MKQRFDLEGKRILVTGGTGSFGACVARALSALDPAQIVIFSRDEKKQHEMSRLCPDFSYVLGDVRDADRVREVMRGIDIVFHAAALKQVPSCEDHPYETVKTNIIGSKNVCEAAVERSVSIVVALSTDKAVKPINAMGMSKALMEKIVISHDLLGSGTRFCCVRYGNVMGSRGSVIPLFLGQIQRGEELTLTIGRMTRFLMTLDESVDLVLHAVRHAQGGEIYVRKAPATTVEDLARAMVRRFGAGKEFRLREVGLRPGEKIDEVLVNEYEIRRARETDAYFEILPEHRPAAREIECAYEYGYEYTSANARRLSEPEDILTLLDRMGDLEGYS